MAADNCLVLHRKSANEPAVEEAVRHARDQGIELRVRIPWNKKDVGRMVEEAVASGARRIVAGGGDGTLNDVADALVGKGNKPPKASLGILPLGTANDFANGCGLPVNDLGRCLEIACTREARPIDVGRVNGRSFLNVVSGGYGAEITAGTPTAMKKALGGTAYTIMGLVKAFSFKPYDGRLLVPGEEAIEGSMIMMAVGNNRLAGGGFEVAPRAELDDGLLDLAVLASTPDTPLARLAQELREPNAPENEILFYRQLATFTIESDEELHMNLDGEPTLDLRFEFSVLPRHLQVVC